MSNSKSQKMVVVAVEFGSTFSGYAFSYKHAYRIDPLKVITQCWTDRLNVHFKVPTCVLFGSDKKFDSFGFEAEDRFLHLIMDSEQEDYYFFNQFIATLIRTGQSLSRSAKLQAENGKEMMAIDVIAAAISFMKNDFLYRSNCSCVNLCEVYWVIIIPRICSDYCAADEFMRKAAQTAGIKSDDVIIVREDETVILSCKKRYLCPESHGRERGLDDKIFSEGRKFLVLDCGGETTVVATVFEIKDSSIKELYKAKNGAWGGGQVNEAFKQLLIKIFGAPVIMKLNRKYLCEYKELFRKFEMHKRVTRDDSDSGIRFEIPMELFELFEKETGEKLEDSVQNLEFAGKIKLRHNRLRLRNDLFKSLFEDAGDQIIAHVNEVLQKSEIKGTDNIIMVGGFSESPILQEMIKTAFPKMRVIIPPEPTFESLRGAVIYGHETLNRNP